MTTEPADLPPRRPRPGYPEILTDEQRRLLSEIREVLTDLRAGIARAGGAVEDETRTDTALKQLDELFLLVVAGEFNAGKSAVLNALLGERVLAEGPTPTTDRIHLLKHADRSGPDDRPPEAGIALVTAESPVLAHMNVVDTPGTNAVLREHEALTREFIPRSDMVLFVTSADRPFTESERAFLEAIRGWGKKVALVINKIDIVFADEDVQRIEAFVTEQASALLGFAPAVFPVSARLAISAKEKRRQAGDEAAEEEWRASRFSGLEVYVVQTLDEAERIRLKLLSPLRVGLTLAEKYFAVVQDRESLLADDFAALADVEGQLEAYREDTRRQITFRLADLETVFHELERRGIEFFADTLRLGRLPDLVSRQRIAKEFEKKVVADLPREVDSGVRTILDWMLAQNLTLWQSVSAHVARRRVEHADRIVGSEGQGFDLDRQRLLDSVARTAQRTVEGYDRRQEADRLAEQAQMAAAGAALLEVGAVGLGAAVALTALDATGLLAAGALAALGFVVLPHRRRKAEEELRKRIDEMRTRLVGSLREQLEREVDAAVEKIRDAISPYTRFVRAERTRLDETRHELDGIRRRGLDLAARVEALR